MESALESWLDAGAAFGVLKESRGVYSLGKRAASLLEEGNDPFRAFYLEGIGLDHDLLVGAPRRLLSGERLAASDLDGSVIARASRMGEPWIAEALRATIPSSGPFRVVEVGCGTGIHLKTMCELSPGLTARGIDIDEDAAAVARANIEKWGLSDRATVEVADIRSLSGNGSADLITLHQNIYYFADDEQADLLAHLRGFLAPGGRILITSVMRRSGAGSAALDMWGAFTEGAARLPIAAELEERLREAGFVDVACRRTSADGVYGMATGTAPTI